MAAAAHRCAQVAPNGRPDERWLDFRLASAAGLATHHVLGPPRSSRAALFEHLHGTLAAVKQFDLPDDFKSSETGGTIKKVRDRSAGSPPTVELNCVVPEWLTDPEAWRAECERSCSDTSRSPLRFDEVSDARGAKQGLVFLGHRHDRVLVLDQHLITLSTLRALMDDARARCLSPPGRQKERKRVEELFAPAAECHRPVLRRDERRTEPSVPLPSFTSTRRRH